VANACASRLKTPKPPMKHLAKIDVPLYLRNKNQAKLGRRANRIWRDKRRKESHHETIGKHFGSRSRIIEMVAGNTVAKEILKGKVIFKAPVVFSLIENPEGTLHALIPLARQLLVRRFRRIAINLSEAKSYDLGANAILDVLVDELRVQARRTGRRLNWSGSYPSDPGLRRFVRAMGVIKKLEVKHEYPLPEEAAGLEAFDWRCKHYIRAVRPNESDLKSRVTQKFADHINGCLKRVSKMLTPPARHRLCQYIGEVIDNAEEHAGMLDWSIQGYLDTHLAVPLCEIVIFSFGRTIAQTFEALPAGHYTRDQVQNYIDLHQQGGLFTAGWRPDDLYTLIALQGHVSTKNNSTTDTRGNGSVDLIEFFQKVHAECAKEFPDSKARMALVSGSTHVQFDGTYKMEPNQNGVRIIAFNKANDLHQRPDSRFVHELKGVYFPGTILSIKFPLSTAKLSTSEGDGK
jgi:hypothetical protein